MKKTGTGTAMKVIRSYDQYMVRLQEERCKIQVFRRELPLCLQLVDQAIENYKRIVCATATASKELEQEEGKGEEGGDKSWNDVPLFEQSIPLKPPQHQDEQHNNNKSNNETKVDWLKSAQLWNQKSTLASHHEDDTSPQMNEKGGTFLPFLKINTLQTQSLPEADDTRAKGLTPPTHVPTTSTSSTADNSRKTKHDKDTDNRKARRCWSQELHRKFLLALQQLGGCHAATPKQIKELMKVDGLTCDEVKSHLQKYRLHIRRPVGSPVHNTGNSQTSQFVMTSGIWGLPQSYTAATKGNATSRSPSKIYVPVAALPMLSAHQVQQRQQLQPSVASPHSKQESDRAEHSMRDHDAHSSSPAAASSTETTTASPHF